MKSVVFVISNEIELENEAGVYDGMEREIYTGTNDALGREIHRVTQP